MRRIARLPKPLAGPANETATAALRNGQRCAFQCHATPAAAVAAASSTPRRVSTVSRAAPTSSLAHGRFFSTSMARRQTPNNNSDLKQREDGAEATTELEARQQHEQLQYQEEVDAEELAAQEQLQLDDPPSDTLVIPRSMGTAPRPDQIGDSTYEPAESGDGLEEVGGLEGWWENNQHWDQSVEFRGFGPRHRVTDPAVLEVLARQAVVEALAVQQQQQQQQPELLTSTTWARDADPKAALALQVEVAADGSVTAVRGDVDAVVAGLVNHEEDVVETAEEAVETSSQLEADEAQALVASWAEDASWKDISLGDAALKFAINKRILQLTGHLLPDAHLANAHTVGGLLAVLVRPPKAKKLAEELAADGVLAGLPNVAVYGRRVTPIDKHKQVGRWKVIVQELEKRGLPVTGTGGHSKSIERRWAFF